MQLSVHGVEKRFGSRVVVSLAHATLFSGETCALVGPSGSGKSTLLGLLAGELSPDAGSVTWSEAAGETPPRPNDVAWVAQNSNSLLSRTALDNASLGALARGATVGAANEAGLDALTQLGLGDRAGERTAALSGGERQRVAFARALAAGTGVVFADEPTAHLDAATAQSVIEALARLTTTHLVVVATHDPHVAAIADRTIDLVPDR